MNIAEILRSGIVRRYHVQPTIIDQNIAAHSWGVAVIYLKVAGSAATMDGLKQALFHDCPEMHIGDTPSNVKWRFGALAEELDRAEEVVVKEMGIDVRISAEDKIFVKIADMIELIWWSQTQADMGNTFYKEIVDRGIQYLRSKNFLDYQPVKEILKEILG